MDKRNASRITSSRSLKSATFHLTGWRLSHQTELPVPLEYYALTLNTIELQLSDAVTDTSMLQCSAQFRIMFINAHFVADNASYALASSATVRAIFNVEEEVVVIHNGWTPKKIIIGVFIGQFISVYSFVTCDWPLPLLSLSTHIVLSYAG